MRAGVLLVLILAGLVVSPLASFAAWAAEELGPDGFPVDWTPEDLQPKMLVPAARDMPARPPVAVTPTRPVREPLVKEVSGLAGYGPLASGNGGMANTVWQAAPRPVHEEELARGVADGLASPALKEAWRTLLLTQAPPPGGAVSGTSWLAVRAKALEDLGFYEAAWSLWRQVPLRAGAVEDGLLYGAVRSRILAGDAAQACAVAKRKTAQVAAYDTRWPVIVAACQMVAPSGTTAGASLSVQLVEKVLRAKNPTLLKILDAVQEGKAVTSGVAKVDALGGAVLAHYPALVGAGVIPKLPDMALRRLADSESLPLALRARAAVALAGVTGWPQDGVQAWALVSATLVSSSAPDVAYATWPDAVIVARGVPEAGGVSASVALARESAAAYVRAALRSDNLAAAQNAWPLWPKEGLKGQDLRAWWQARLATAVLQGKVEPAQWQAWLAVQVLDTQAGVRQAQRTLLAADGLGVAVPAAVWKALRDKALPVAGLVDPAWQRLLADAQKARNLPGVLALVSEAWRQDTGDKVAPEQVGAGVAALRELGQVGWARRLATEAMLGVADGVYVVKPGRVERQKAPVATVMDKGLDGRGGIGRSARAAEKEDGGLPMLPPPRVRAPVKPVAPVPPTL